MAQFIAPEQLENSSGSPLSGGKKYVYAVGTTTALSLFSDDTLSTPAANPIVADSSGAFAGVFLAETECKQLVTTSADVTVFSRAVFYTVGVSNVLAADDVSYSGATSGLASEDVQAAIDEVVALQATSQAWTSASDGPIATGTSTNAGAAVGPLVEMYRNSASPANSDVIGGMRLTGKNASAVKTTYVETHGVITDTTNGSEDGEYHIVTRTNGADSTATKFAAGTVDAANGFFSGGNRISGAPDAVLEDQKATNTAGGTFTSGAWQTRDLNTEVRDTFGVISLSSNQFTPTVNGWVEWTAPGVACDSHKTRLFNVTDTTVAGVGTSSIAPSAPGDDGETLSVGGAAVVAGKAYRIEHRCGTTKSTNGFGQPSNLSTTEVYTRVKYWRA